jgi:hypothetical protein
MKAVEVIMEHGVPEDRIIFINLVRGALHTLLSVFRDGSCPRVQVSAPQGLKAFTTRYPALKVVGLLLPSLPSFFFVLLTKLPGDRVD